jgi:dihydroxyacetone kinase-like predicted kinase
VEVTKAIRTTTVDGLRVRVGQDIALLDGTLAVAEDSPQAAVRESLRRLVNDQTSLVTIYYGAQSTAEDAGALADEIRAVYPSLQVDIVYGGQPHYGYIISLE